MSEVFPGVEPTADPTTDTPTPAPTPVAADPSLSDIVSLVSELRAEIAELKQNPVVAGLINADETGPDRMGGNPFVEGVKNVFGDLEHDFRLLIRDEVSKISTTVTASPAVSTETNPAIA